MLVPSTHFHNSLARLIAEAGAHGRRRCDGDVVHRRAPPTHQAPGFGDPKGGRRRLPGRREALPMTHIVAASLLPGKRLGPSDVPGSCESGY